MTAKADPAKKPTRAELRAAKKAQREALVADLRTSTNKLPFDIQRADALRIAAWKKVHARAIALTTQSRPRPDAMGTALTALAETADAPPPAPR